MTSQSAGAQWLRDPSSSLARPRNHPPTQQTPRSVPCQVTVGLTGGSNLGKHVEPASKKQKLDLERHTAGSNVREDSSECSRRSILMLHPEAKISFDNSVKDTPVQLSSLKSEHDLGDIHTRRGPIFPVRPRKNAYRHQSSAQLLGKAGVREAVQVRPYVAEPPSSAPRYQEDGKFHLTIFHLLD